MDRIGSNEKHACRHTMVTLMKRELEKLHSFQTKWISDGWRSKNKASDMFEENRKESEVQEHSAGTGTR